MLIKCGEYDVTNRVLSCIKKGAFSDKKIIGQVPSFQLDLKLDNRDDYFNDKLNELFSYVESGSNIEHVFVVYDKPERYTKELSLKLYDRSYELGVPYLTQLNYVEEQITISDQLDEISLLTGFIFDRTNIPNWIMNRVVKWYDNTIVIRNYLGWIAELFAANVFAEGFNTFKFVPISKDPKHKTSMVSDYKKGELFKIARVCFDNSVMKAEKGTDDGNTLYVSCNNSYIEADNKDEVINYVYSIVNGLNVHSLTDFKTKNISELRPGDIINYNDEFNVMALDISSKAISAASIVQDVKGEMVSKNEEKQVNRVDNTTRIRVLRVEFDQEKLKWSVTAEEVEGQNEKIGQLELSNEEIKLSLKKVEEKIKNIDTTLYHAELNSTGTSITIDTPSITLTAMLMNASNEVITSDSAFNLKRVSSNTAADTIWNNAHKGVKSVFIDSSDLDKSANFYCEVTAPEWKGKTSSITINDETKIPQLSSSFLDVTGVQLVQTLNTDGTYSPSWTQLKPVITPSVIDGVLDVPLNECTIEYKRVVNGTEQPLISGETVTNGILTINKNVMSKTLTSITYICFITYKEVSIKLFASFSLNIVGETGAQGIGIKGVLDEYYVSTSSDDTIGGSWSSAKPIWSVGKYLWKRTKTTKTDNSVTYTTAYCDNSWEAVNEIEIGVRNIALGTSTAKENLRNCDYIIANVEFKKTEYTVSFVAKANIVGTINVYLNDDSGQGRLHIAFGSVSLTTQYQKFVFTVSSSKEYIGDTTGMKIRVYGTTENTLVSVKDLKLEYGNKATDWTPAPEDQKQDLVDTEVRITESYNSAIEETNKNIRLFVAESIEATGDWQSALNSLKNEVVLTKDATEFLKTSSQVIKDLQTGKVDINEIKEWARFDGATLELGASNSRYKTKLTTTELGFYEGNTKVAWISNNELHVTSISAEKSVKIGTFIFEDEGAYGLTLKKVGG